MPDYAGTEIIQLRCLIAVPDSGSNDGGVILGMITSGDPSFWELRYRTGGGINVRAWRNFIGPPVLDSPSLLFVPGPNGPSSLVGIDGRSGQLGLTLTRSGDNIDYVVDFIEQGASVGYVWGTGVGSVGATVVAGASVGKATRIQTCTDGGHVDVTLGHIVVRNDSRDFSTHVKQLNAWRGETVGERLARLRDENAMWYVQYDPPPPYYPIVSDIMGPQPVGTVLDLFRDCERTDGGHALGRPGAGVELHHQALPRVAGTGAHARCGGRRGGVAVRAGPRRRLSGQPGDSAAPRRRLGDVRGRDRAARLGHRRPL